jgi:Ca-activated chloride channel family protein
MLVVDVSASMEAVDVAPNRMTAAVTAAKDFVEDLPDGVQVGLVAFDRAARVVTTPTDDHDAVITGLDRLETGQGTAAGEGIYTALDALGVVEEGQPAADDDPVTAIVLLSDGTTTVGRPVEEAATAAEEESVPITTIAYGTDAGTVEVDGQTIAVPADASTMEAVAEATGGTAFVAASGDELAGIYEDIGSRIGYEVQQREIGMRFVAVGAGLLMASLLAAMAWMGRII